MKWKWICKPKSKGGPSVKDLIKFNISLMCKWWWKLEHNSGPLQDFISLKYLKGSGVYYTKHRPGDSPLWAYMLQLKKYLSLWQKDAGGEWYLDQFLG
jgi:hypothetical protein